MDEWICYERHLFWNNLFQGFPYRQFFMYWHDANEHVCCLILWHASLVSGPAGTCNTLPKVQFTPQRLHLSHLVIAAVHVRRCWGGDMRELITSGSTDEVQAVYEAVEPQTWLGWPFFNESFWFSQKAWDSDYSEEPGRALRWAVFVETASVHENVQLAQQTGAAWSTATQAVKCHYVWFPCPWLLHWGTVKNSWPWKIGETWKQPEGAACQGLERLWCRLLIHETARIFRRGKLLNRMNIFVLYPVVKRTDRDSQR